MRPNVAQNTQRGTPSASRVVSSPPRQKAAQSLEPRLKELVSLRISQINGCAFCIDMHWAGLLKLGMDPRHVNAVAGWREAHRFFSDSERASLNWAEAVNADGEQIVAI